MSTPGAQPRDDCLVLLFLGGYADVVQMASVHESLARRDHLSVRVVVTGEDPEGVERGLDTFGFRADQSLTPTACPQDRDRFSTELLAVLEAELESQAPAIALVSGHSTTAFCVALACHQSEVPVGHVGAGLRQTRGCRPPRDEVNCVMVDAVADLNFAPHARAEENLIQEGIDASKIFVVGDPADDSLQTLGARIKEAGPDASQLERLAERTRRWMVVTCDPRAHSDDERDVIFESIRHLAIRYHEVASIVVPEPVHPGERELVADALGGFANVHVISALGHADYVWLAHAGAVFMTDGEIDGKLALHRPGAILRQMLAGSDFEPAEAASLADLDRDSIVNSVVGVLEDGVPNAVGERHPRKSVVARPGDRISHYVADYLGLVVEPAERG